jgi:hypothetical protein
MFSELPKLFDRNFAIAYFLPVSLLLTISAFILKAAGYWSQIYSFLTGNTLFDATLAVFTAWIGGILLMVLNREIYRLLEGYGKYNPVHLFEKHAKRQFVKKMDRLDVLDNEYGTKDFTEEKGKERARLMVELAESYPDREDLILPTAFGNALRAFEIYPRVMYGFEGIDGWPRILAVLPKEYRELIDDAKAQVDWWVNLGVISILLLIEFWGAVYSKWGLTLGWFYNILNILVPLVIVVLLNWFFLWRATSAAVGWGDYVKSAFDLYRFSLLEQLGIEPPTSREQEEKLWKSFSQAIINRRPDMLPRLMAGNSTTDAPPPDVKKKKQKGK